jgi:hypothetical protein
MRRLLPALLLLSGCTGPQLQVHRPPTVAPAAGATVTIARDRMLTGPRQWVLLDDVVVSHLELGEHTRLVVAPGPRAIGLVCFYGTYQFDKLYLGSAKQYDGEATLVLDFDAGTDVCLKASRDLFTCAKLEVAPPDFCAAADRSRFVEPGRAPE